MRAVTSCTAAPLSATLRAISLVAAFCSSIAAATETATCATSSSV